MCAEAVGAVIFPNPTFNSDININRLLKRWADFTWKIILNVKVMNIQVYVGGLMNIHNIKEYVKCNLNIHENTLRMIWIFIATSW